MPILYWDALGPGASAAEGDVVTEPLVPIGCRLIAATHRGFGVSHAAPPEAYRASHLAALLWAVGR